ncbi:MAG: hypothetical protein GX842_07795 [Spirochaetales bacterium]|nr:hypothetical protein [Spirochaetales bacterium]
MEDEAKKFIEELEERHGGKVEYRTFSTWFASNQGVVREFGVFIYEINGVFYYEDFERKPSLFGFSLRPRKNRPPYVKLEGSFKPEAIVSVSRVAKSQAAACAAGYRTQESLPPAGTLQKIFSSLVTRVVLDDGKTYFLELLNHKEFEQVVREATGGSVQGL